MQTAKMPTPWNVFFRKRWRKKSPRKKRIQALLYQEAGSQLVGLPWRSASPKLEIRPHQVSKSATTYQHWWVIACYNCHFSGCSRFCIYWSWCWRWWSRWWCERWRGSRCGFERRYIIHTLLLFYIIGKQPLGPAVILLLFYIIGKQPLWPVVILPFGACLPAYVFVCGLWSSSDTGAKRAPPIGWWRAS